LEVTWRKNNFDEEIASSGDSRQEYRAQSATERYQIHNAFHNYLEIQE
jgi:hypothetical protein